MKQVITIEQLEELTLQQKDILRKWWNPEIHTFFVVNNTIYPCEDGEWFGKDEVANGGCIFKKDKCLPLLSIGQCLEILEQNFACVSICIIPQVKNKFCLHLWKDESDFEDEPLIIYRENDIDALWEGVKLVLSNKI